MRGPMNVKKIESCFRRAINIYILCISLLLLLLLLLRVFICFAVPLFGGHQSWTCPDLFPCTVKTEYTPVQREMPYWVTDVKTEVGSTQDVSRFCFA